MKQGANWFAWTLQFIAGLIVGGIVAIYFMMRNWRYSNDISSLQFWLIAGGGGLLAAGLSSHFGDRFWTESYNRVIPDWEFTQSRASILLSLGSGLLGCGMIGYSVFYF
jgi:hypothetical protein